MHLECGMECGRVWESNAFLFLDCVRTFSILQISISHFTNFLRIFISDETEWIENIKCRSVLLFARFCPLAIRKNTQYVHTSFVKVGQWIEYYFWPITTCAYRSESVSRTYTYNFTAVYLSIIIIIIARSLHIKRFFFSGLRFCSTSFTPINYNEKKGTK